MRSVLTALSFALGLALSLPYPALLTGPAAAQGEAPEDEYPGEEGEESPGELAGEAMRRLMQALDLLIGSIPQYEAPYVNENGDIIIRRKRAEDLPTPRDKPAPPDVDSTTT